MNGLLERVLKATRLYHPLRNRRVRRRNRQQLVAWQRAGRPVPPPPAAKQQNLLACARQYGLRILVETGTYRGDTVEALRKNFERIYSIELSPFLFAQAQERFRSAKNVELIHGDSGAKLADLMRKLDQPALFWLDGHYSAGITAKGDKITPIFEELGHIFSAPSRAHAIAIDDARLFGTDPGYPTLEELVRFVRDKKPDAEIVVQDDIIRILPRN